MSGILEQAVNGLMMGAIYAVFAIGMVLIYGVMRVLNFAHGALFMVGAYVCQFIFMRLTGNYPLAIIGAMLVLAVIGCGLERAVFRRLRAHFSMQIVASIGLVLVIQNLVIVIFGPTALQMRVASVETILRLGPIAFTAQHVLIVAIAAIAVAGLQMFLLRTRLGTAIRATSQNQEAARVVGIDPDRMFLLTFAIASGLAALGGALLGPLFLISPGMGDLPLLKGLTAIVLGGMGSVPGAIVGGLAIGLVEAESTLIVPTDYRDTIVFLLLIGMLLLRPQGMFGQRLRDAI